MSERDDQSIIEDGKDKEEYEPKEIKLSMEESEGKEAHIEDIEPNSNENQENPEIDADNETVNKNLGSTPSNHDLSNSKSVIPADPKDKVLEKVEGEAQSNLISETEKSDSGRIEDKKQELQNLMDSISSRKKLLEELKKIGKEIDGNSPDKFFFRISQLEDEVGLRDKQITTHLKKIEDLERLLKGAKRQLREVGHLKIEVRSKEEDLEKLKEEQEVKERSWNQLKEELEFKLSEEVRKSTNLQQSLIASQSETKEQILKANESEKARFEMAQNLESQLKEKEELAKDAEGDFEKKSELLSDELRIQKELLDEEKRGRANDKLSLTKLEHENQNLEQRITQHEAKRAKVVAELQAQLESDKKLYKEQIIENEKLRSSIYELREKINSLEDEMVNLRKVEINPLDEVDLAEDEKKKLYESEKETPRVLSKSGSTQSKVNNIKVIEKLRSKKSSISSTPRNIQKTLKETVENDRIENQLSEARDRIDELEVRLEEATRRIDSARRDEESAKSKRSEAIKRYKSINEKFENLKKELDLKDEELSAIKSSKIKTQVYLEKSKEAREKAFTAQKKAESKLQSLADEYSLLKKEHDKVVSDYAKYKESLATKDQWIIKQGDEIMKLKEQISKLRTHFNSYKFDIESNIGTMVNERDTEIMVLKEMVKSTKSMVRAKDVDISRLKRKLQNSSPEEPQFFTKLPRRSNLNFSINTIKRGARPRSILRNSMRKKIEVDQEDDRKKRVRLEGSGYLEDDFEDTTEHQQNDIEEVIGKIESSHNVADRDLDYIKGMVESELSDKQDISEDEKHSPNLEDSEQQREREAVDHNTIAQRDLIKDTSDDEELPKLHKEPSPLSTGRNKPAFEEDDNQEEDLLESEI